MRSNILKVAIKLVLPFIVSIAMVFNFFIDNPSEVRSIEDRPKWQVIREDYNGGHILIRFNFQEDINNGKILFRYKITSFGSSQTNVDKCFSVRSISLSVNSYGDHGVTSKSIYPNFFTCETEDRNRDYEFDYDFVGLNGNMIVSVGKEYSDFIDVGMSYFHSYPYDDTIIAINTKAIYTEYTRTPGYINVKFFDNPVVLWSASFSQREYSNGKDNHGSLVIRAERLKTYKYLFLIMIIASWMMISLIIFVNDFSVFYQSIIAVFFGTWVIKQVIIPSYINIYVLFDNIIMYIYLYFIFISIYTLFILYITKKFNESEKNKKLLIKLIMSNRSNI